ncbi:hypothetical protein [Thermoactinomyces mirandus]|nr:hypothetical protein [Thermoactinomyces mirandus]
MKCRLHRHLPLDGMEKRPNADFLISEVVQFHIDDELYFSGKIDEKALLPVGRLAGTNYVRSREMFSMPHLFYHEWIAQNKKSRS